MKLFAALLLFLSVTLPGLSQTNGPPAFRALVFTKTAGYRHESIPAGVDAVRRLGSERGFAVDATEDAGVFTDEGLAPYQVVVFLSTTGDVLNDDQQAAFERYIRRGGGFAGVHAATDTEYGWPWYGRLVGGVFESHPAIQRGTVVVADRVHPSTASLPERWVRTDEWYNFRLNRRGKVHVLATLDERTYEGGGMGFDHPIAWCQEFEGGRSWYTALGHTTESYGEPEFLAHLAGGIETAAGVRGADCAATLDGKYQKVILDDDTLNPMELDVAPDGRVFFVERGGAVKIYRPDSRRTVVAGQIAVATAFEDGLLGIALDPKFAENGWAYLFYSPFGTVAEQRLSRFTVHDDALDPASERIMLRVPTQREQCCHSGGSLAFGPDGSLFLSTGDNTNPFESEGYNPIDERPGRSPWDAQKSSGNANDLRGKILRILPQPDGTYAIPNGNLFPRDGSRGRPEIYVVGNRNPFRISVDSATGWLYWGEVGPDAGEDRENRGPRGYDEFNQARAAGNFGWPFCIADNQPYGEYDFATGAIEGVFDCAAPENDSPNNTGERVLPPAQPAWIWYPYAESAEFPELGSGFRTAMAGPVYHFDPALRAENRLPAYFDGTLFLYEWSRNWIKEVKLDRDGNVLKINPFGSNLSLQRPMDMEIGPDGVLYLLEWGSGFGGNNADSRLVRIDYVNGSLSPVARASASVTSGPAPLAVQFSSEGSADPDPEETITYAWDFDLDGTTDSTDPNPAFTYAQAGNYTVRLIVTDRTGKTGAADVAISVGNTAPVVRIDAPPDGSFFRFGETIRYRVTPSDAEDTAIDCARVTVQLFQGHDTHSHPLQQSIGCEGEFPVQNEAGHSGESNLFLLLDAVYTDAGAPGVAPLATQARVRLQPHRLQAEHFASSASPAPLPSHDPQGGGLDIPSVSHGNTLSFRPIRLDGIGSISFRVQPGGNGGRIEVRDGAPDGPLLGTAEVPPGGDEEPYRNVTARIRNPGESREVFFVFLRSPGDRDLFSLNWIEFDTEGVQRGDVNGDGQVTVVDAVLALRAAVGLESLTSEQARAGDGNGNGSLEVSDVVLILRRAVGLS